MLPKTLIVFFVMFLSLNSHSEIIKKININGLSTTDRGTVLNFIPAEVNDDFNQELSKRIIESLKSSKLFENASISFKDGDLTVLVKENPVIKYFDISGYEEDKVLSKGIIQKIQDNYGMKIGKIFLKENLDAILNTLSEVYSNNGYYNSSIKTKLSKDSSNRLGIELIIEESEPALIDSFEIKGSNFLNESDLLELFEIGTPDIFFINYFTEKDKFNKTAFDSGMEKIKSKYLSSGFLDYKVNNVTINQDEDKKISILIDIDEGSQYFVNNITWSGEIDELNINKATQFFNIKKGDVFSRKKILSELNVVRNLYADKGYSNATIETSISLSTFKENYLDLKLNFQKNNRMYVNRIDIRGNNKTQDNVIRREMTILENQEFSKSQLDESIKKIKRLGYFSNVDVKTSQSPNHDDRLDIIVNVTEQKTGEFSIGISQSNASGASFNTGIQQNNIFGTGNTFNAKFSNSSAVEEMSFYFKNPYFTKNGNSLSYGLFSKTTNAANLDISDYNIDESGGSLGYGIPIDSNSEISTEIKISDISVNCSDKFASELYEQAQCSSSDSLDFSLIFKYVSNSLNDFFSPTSGSKTTLSSGLAIPLGDFKYYQLGFKKTDYFPIFQDLTFNTKFDTQIAQGYGNSDLPFFKRYFGGGSSSVRGFDFNSLGEKYPDNKAKGGELSLLSSAAIIAPGKKIGIENNNIRISAFMDAGSIYEKTSNFDISDIRVSGGIALSWLTPIGPIGFYAAKPLIKKSTDSTKTFSFELGTTF